MGRQFVIAARPPFQERKYRVHPQCLCNKGTVNKGGRAIGCSIREKLWTFDLIQVIRAREVEQYFVNDNGTVLLRSLLHVPADLTSE